MEQINPSKHPATLASVTQGQQVHGFEARAVYLDAAGARMGGRFVHGATGFELDLVFIESAPQGFIWVNSFPTSDMGEPHTQEHLLLGKGNKGRFVASAESMSLADSSAFTMQWRTCYHFHTIAGLDVFWDVLEHKLDGLLHPDYSDEEIRREVRNFGVGTDPKTGALHLEEKGTVYNEMVRSFESPTRNLWRTLGQLQYGPTHPLAFSSGGLPAAIREMTPTDIRAFHRANYHLANMGMIASFPRSVALGDILDQIGATLARQHAGAPRGVVTTEATLSRPSSAAPGTVALVGYPHSNAERPGSVILSWPPVLELPLGEDLLLELFLENFAGDATTRLYKKLVDSKTRTMDVGATGVWSWISSDLGHPVHVGINDVKAEHLTEDGVRALRTVVRQELAAIAALPDGSPELAAFNQLLSGRITETRRGLAKFMNSPPRFGFRGTGSGWMEHLHRLERADRFEKSLTLQPELAYVERELARPENIWRTYLERWRLLELEPYAGASVADPTLLTRERADREARLAAELKRLGARYGTSTEADTLARYRADYDANTAALEAAGKDLALPGFIDVPPMTLDDALVYEHASVSGVPIVRSTFESMTGATVGAAFDARVVPEEDLPYLSALTSLMTQVGVIEDGVPISYEEMTERQRKEIMSLSVYVSTNYRSGRVELVVKGAGNDLPETARALAWMRLVLHHPNWRVENLPRIRDVVDRVAKRLRDAMTGAEENWVNDPADIYAHQDRPVFAHTQSFLTRAHDVHRLRWQLRALPADAAAARTLTGYLQALGAASALSRAELIAVANGESTTGAVKALLARRDALPASARGLATEALEDLAQLVGELPDQSLAADWRYLCDQIRLDLAMDPGAVLAKLDQVRGLIARRGAMRMFGVGSRAAHQEMRAGTEALVASVPEGRAAAPVYSTTRFIDERLFARTGQRAPAARPVFVGLVNPNTQGGVFINAARGSHYTDRDPEALLDYLTSNTYSGHGAHSMFMKTWSAGLAYSNGLRGSLGQGQIRYYAERCPELPQTVRFVIAELERAEPDDGLVDYAVAQAFSSRVAASFEGRGEAMASDYADGVTPKMVRGFREALVALRKKRGRELGKELHARLPAVYGRVLPGYGPASRSVNGAAYFAIGPDKQLDAYGRYLEAVEGADATLHRLYPRDFWVPRPVTP